MFKMAHMHFILHKIGKYSHHRDAIAATWHSDGMVSIELRMHMCIYSSGIEGNPTVFYRLMPGSTAQTNKFHTFYLQQRPDNGDTWADIKVNHPLDYESIKEYNLTIRVEVSQINFVNIFISISILIASLIKIESLKFQFKFHEPNVF